MLNKLIDVILQFLSQLMPVFIVKPYEEAVQLWMGSLQRSVGCGWYFKVPFLHQVECASVVTDVAVFQPQYVTTLDDKTVAFKLALTYSVKDVKKFMLEVEDAETSLADTAIGTVADLFSSATWDEIRKRAWEPDLRALLRRRAGEFGIRISRVQFATLAVVRTYGLLHES